jgi:hypothetical protein
VHPTLRSIRSFLLESALLSMYNCSGITNYKSDEIGFSLSPVRPKLALVLVH